MDWLSKNYDRILLLFVSLAALAFAVLMILNSATFKNRFIQDRPVPKSEVVDPGTAEVETVATALGEKNDWAPRMLGEKKIVPLNVSIPLVEKDGVVVDMFIDEPSLRDPVPNTWLIDNEILFLRADCLELDPDKDGFNNLEEWKGSTDPQVVDSHPPLTDKLVMVEKVEIPYTLTFSGTTEPYQLRRLAPEKRSWFKSKGDTFEEDRFTVGEYTKKEIEDPNLGMKDVSELIVYDNLWKEDVVLVHREEKHMPTLFAIFEYRRAGKEQFQVKKGDIFELPNEADSSYKLTSVSDEGAEIKKVGPTGAIEEGAEAIRIPFSK